MSDEWFLEIATRGPISVLFHHNQGVNPRVEGSHGGMKAHDGDVVSDVVGYIYIYTYICTCNMCIHTHKRILRV